MQQAQVRRWSAKRVNSQTKYTFKWKAAVRKNFKSPVEEGLLCFPEVKQLAYALVEAKPPALAQKYPTYTGNHHLH